jgi:hypothetical protein
VQSGQQPKFYNRIVEVMQHTSRYAFKGKARLAVDAKVGAATITRITTGQGEPLFHVLAAITGALERAVGRKIDPRELISMDGTYPTASVCELVGCPGCTPESAYDEDGNRKPDYSEPRHEQVPSQSSAQPDDQGAA